MKNYPILILLILNSFTGFSQNSASATIISTAKVVEPIEITKNIDLHFGNVIGGNPGRLILTPDGSRISYGIELSAANPGEVSPAEATVTHGSYNYSITLPENFRLYNQENPNQFLLIDNFTVEPHFTGEFTDILKIGATLNIEANQPGGMYTNSSGFNVTVTYN